MLWARTVAWLLVLVITSVSCTHSNDSVSPEERRQQQYALNTRMLSECLGQFAAQGSDSLLADKALNDFYRDTLVQRLWVPELAPTAEADSLVAVLSREARIAGFPATAFDLKQIRFDLDSVRRVSTDSLQPMHIEQLARIEYLLTKAYLRFVKGQRYGFVDNPDKLLLTSNQHIRQAPGGFLRKALDEAVAGRAVSFVVGSRPSSPLYKRLEELLAQAKDSASLRRIMANMERERWTNPNHPKDTTEKHVLVNVAAQQLWAVSADTVFQMRTVCGARASRTPLMRGDITLVVVNPLWRIPPKIVRDEISRHGGDASYFQRHRYFITNSQGDTLHPSTVSSDDLAACRYRVTQHRGPGNSLGRLKFHFANSFSVYLHDTNNPGAFGRADRCLSHGCVRVKRPFDLACFLLGLDAERDAQRLDRLRVAIGQEPLGDEERAWLAEHGEDQTLVLNRCPDLGVRPAVPVYIIYYTIYPNPESDKLETWGDPYGFDRDLCRALRLYTLPSALPCMAERQLSSSTPSVLQQ